MIFAAYSPGERASRLPAVGSVGVSDATRRAVMLSSQDDAGRSGGMADATVSKTVGPQGSCGFDSHLRHHKRISERALGTKARCRAGVSPSCSPSSAPRFRGDWPVTEEWGTNANDRPKGEQSADCATVVEIGRSPTKTAATHRGAYLCGRRPCRQGPRTSINGD